MSFMENGTIHSNPEIRTLLKLFCDESLVKFEPLKVVHTPKTYSLIGCSKLIPLQQLDNWRYLILRHALRNWWRIRDLKL